MNQQSMIAEIDKIRRERNAVILAHYYQENVIQDIADHTGDSLQLAVAARDTDAEVILFAGVHFMAETAKILNPERRVLLPDMDAGCSLAESCPTADFAAFKAAHPDHIVLSYVNCTAEIKALSDIIVTSSNAEKIVRTLPPEQPIIFAPDRNLGAWLSKTFGREMLLWDGACEVHEIFRLDSLQELKLQNPKSPVLAHPECTEQLLEEADFIGSTAKMLRYARENSANSFIVMTEPGIIHQMQSDSPQKSFIEVPGFKDGEELDHNYCPYMRLITLDKVYHTLRDGKPEITLPAVLMDAARKPITRMLELS
jgi:quinolinate synthase